MHGKKENPAGARKIPKKGKGDTAINGKIVPFRPGTSKPRKQGQGKKSFRDETQGRPKSLRQTEIPFPDQDGVIGTARKFAFCSFGCKEGNTCGARMGACIATNSTDEKRKEGIATAH